MAAPCHSPEHPETLPSTLWHGCSLPAAWAQQAQWRILDTDFGLGQNFLATWAAWQADPARPRLLHFVACLAQPLAGAELLRAAPPAWHALAHTLAAQCWGLLPGVHRLGFDGGRVLLTLYIGDAHSLLRQQQPEFDSIYLGPLPTAEADTLHLLKTLARCCRRGTLLAHAGAGAPLAAALAQCGFTVQPQPTGLQARFDPSWTLRHAGDKPAPLSPSHCVVVGSGLAGSAAAASLARRGWQVTVLDQGLAPAAGASGLPAGLFALHSSPDDAPLSRLTRAGLRLVRETAQALLTEGQDWAPSGVLEHCVDGKLSLPSAWQQEGHPGADWLQPASDAQRAAAGLPPNAVAQWHSQGGWVRPARLIAALLAQSGIRWQGGSTVARIERAPDTAGAAPQWHLYDSADQLLAQAPLVVLATGAGSITLCQERLQAGSLRPLRGQVSWGPVADCPTPLPPFPVNGHGNLVPQAPTEEGAPIWVLGSTFERGQTQLPKSAEEEAAGQAYNQQRLQGLLPALAQAMAPLFAQPGAVQAWAGVRCAAPDRRPAVGPIDPALPGLCLSTAFGARGLTNALLCGEILAAQLHAEPLPLEAKVAQSLQADRLRI